MKLWRKLLWPLVPFYYLGSLFVKKMYDWGFYTSKTYDFPLITVGNLSAGGTGKSPFVIYLVNLLLPHKKIAALSRGYGRSTNGFRVVDIGDTATLVGDEPLQLKQKFPEITVAVDANRRNGIEKLLQKNNPEIIILDDAFQHRKVKAGLQIVLTTYDNLYVNDFPLPAGDLREPISAAARAQVIVVTKCPIGISAEAKEKIIAKLKPKTYQKVFFAGINYAQKVVGKDTEILLKKFIQNEFCLVTGIANPTPLLDFLMDQKANFIHKKFTDHHNFSEKEINELSKNKTILTTEKDFMRLQHQALLQEKLFYLPIEMVFLGKEAEFNHLILQFTQAN